MAPGQCVSGRCIRHSCLPHDQQVLVRLAGNAWWRVAVLHQSRHVRHAGSLGSSLPRPGLQAARKRDSCVTLATAGLQSPALLAPEQADEYWYPGPGSSRVFVTVRKERNVYAVTFTVKPAGAGTGDFQLHWGAYRASASKWFRLEGAEPAGSKPDKESGGTRTPLTKSNRTSWSLALNVPADLAPVLLGCRLVASSASNSNGSGSGKGTQFSVPLGMQPGSVAPAGAAFAGMAQDGTYTINFAVRSRLSSGMSLVVARNRGDQAAAGCLEIALDPLLHRTGDVWHVRLHGLRDPATLCYGWRADGSLADQFFPSQVMFDPYAPILAHVTLPKGVNVRPPQGAASGGEAVEAGSLLLGSLAALQDTFDWRGAQRPATPLERSCMLELDVAQFTAGDAGGAPVPPQRQGKFLGILHRLRDIQDCGATAVILAPVSVAVAGGLGAAGRSSLSFFAPDPAFAVGTAANAASQELKQVVCALHEAGIEVILQVEFCFTGEGTDADPEPSSLRGLDAGLYYRPNGVLNVGHALAAGLVSDALRHWATEYQLDGFVLLNAETLCQGRSGEVLDSPPLAEALAADPLLRGLKLAAWAADDSLLPRAGVRGFPHWATWLERNKRFTADFVQFLGEGAPGLASSVATRITGSADLFEAQWADGLPGSLAAERRASFGLNALTTLGGPTLRELAAVYVPDGDWGTDPGYVEHQRATLVRSLLAAQILSQGVPLLQAPALWGSAAMAGFVAALLSLRYTYADLLLPPSFQAPRDLRWHGATPDSQPDWDGAAAAAGAPGASYLAYSLRDEAVGRALFVGYNPHHYVVGVALPGAPGGCTWRRLADTGLGPPEDVTLEGGAELAAYGGWYDLAPRAALVLEAVRTAAWAPPAAPVASGEW